ncbi:MAG: hypothetical protein H6737_29550 [Alphaproteobacteria bacterium]|nr:hypothetical protein [Alphaproteobacteria bacterium]
MNVRLLALALPLSASCARMAPERVAEGVARLTVRAVGGVLAAANADADCGFASPGVGGVPSISGTAGETGTVTWTVEACTIDLGPEPVELSTDCNGVTTWASGRVTVSARKQVTGRLTGDPETPVIPETPDAAVFLLDDATFADFHVTKSNSDGSMRIIEGSLEATIAPRLAADAENGACSVITPHIEITGITWGPANVEVFSGKKQFGVPIRGGTLDATNGVVGDHENRLEGALTLWNNERRIELPDALDPDYDLATLDASYTCKPELAQPVRFECDLDPILAENTARLIVKNFGLFSKTVDLDESCGFGNLMGQVSELISLGSLGGLIFGTPQTLVFDANSCIVGGSMFPITTDCVGTDYFLDGTATITGTKTVTGRIALDDDPLQPQDRESALVELTHIGLSEVTPLERAAGSSAFEPHLTLHGGTMSGTYHPITGEAADDPGAYFIVIPVGEFESVRLRNSDVTLHNGAMSFPMHVDDSDLYAFTGAYLDRANWLYGTVTIDGVTWQIGADGAIPLDPDFELGAFEASYVCIDNLMAVVPVD